MILARLNYHYSPVRTHDNFIHLSCLNIVSVTVENQDQDSFLNYDLVYNAQSAGRNLIQPL